MKELVVIGAGITGLTAAYYLRERFPGLLVVEASARTGGVIASAKHHGFQIEYGPNSTLLRPPLAELLTRLNISSHTIVPSLSARKRYLARAKEGPMEILAAPSGLVPLVTTPLLSLPAKLRILLEPFQPGGQREDETVYEFMSRRFGPQITSNIVGAVLGGIWAADIQTLSMRSALPKLWGLEHQYGSILYGGIRQMFQNIRKGHPEQGGMVTFPEGLSFLPNTLAAHIGEERILYEAEVTHLGGIDDGVRIHTSKGPIDARRVICAIPANILSGALAPFLPDLSAQISQIPYNQLGIAHMALERRHTKHLMDGVGFLAPPRKGSPLLGALFISSMFPDRAPESKHLVTCFLGGAINPGLSDPSDAENLNRAMNSLQSALGYSGTPELVERIFYQRAIPNYALGHHRIVEAISEHERTNPRILFAGNWRSGVSISDCVRQGQEAAAKMLNS